MHTLLPQQSAIIYWVVNEQGSLEVVARAGCGKTFTLLEIIKTIIAKNLGEFCLMAYNKSIAYELKGKLEALKVDWKQGTAGTVHSYGIKAWRKVAPNVVVDADKVSKIVDVFAATEKDELFWNGAASAIIRMVGYAKQRAIGYLCPIDDANAWVEIWDHFGVEETTTEDWPMEMVIAAAQKVFKRSLSMDREVIDFDDMILAPLIHKAKIWPKKWVLVDEAQDTNPARRAFALKMLDPKGGRLVFVGDDCQAIYGFTGADADSMEQLRVKTKAKTLPLNMTMRCPKAVVALAQGIVPDITAHPDAPEGKIRAIDYSDLLNETLKPTDAILCRNTAPLVQTAFMLIAKGIPCKIEGRDIGQGLIKLSQRWKVQTLEQLEDRLEKYQVTKTEKFRAEKKESLLDQLMDQLECLRVIIARCRSLNKYTVAELIEVIQGMFADTLESGKPILTLSTIHKSKGREWPRVFALGREQYLPSPYAKKPWQQVQESNLEYVLITRAQQEFIDVSAPPKKEKA